MNSWPKLLNWPGLSFQERRNPGTCTKGAIGVGPLFELVKSVLRSYPGIFSNAAVDVLYLVVLGLIASQYAGSSGLRKSCTGRRQTKLFGRHSLRLG